MRHRVKGRRLGRTASHRKALGKNLVSSLFLHGRIETTLPKAKEYRPMAEKLITKAKTKDLHRVRHAVKLLGSKAAVARLFDEIGPSMKDRPGGYTRIVKLGRRRLGDQGTRVLLELVDYAPASASDVDGAE